MTVSSSGGYVIAGRYQLESALGRGGMGSVWLARDLTLGSPVAVKLIDATLATNQELRARFYQEAKSAAALRSPHVVQIFDYGVHQDVPFIAMELLEGESLASRLARVRVLPYAETSRVLLDVARAMKKAHEAGIVHRDLKPDNIFLVKNDDQEIAKILDFGIAKTTGSGGAAAHRTSTGAVIGTLPYMSPEQAMGHSVDFRTDVWAMGVIAFECVCGRLPFPSETTGELIVQICAHPLPVPSQVARVPQGFDAFWARAASRDPGTRFQSAKELAEALAGILAHLPGPEVPASLLTPPGAAVSDSATTVGHSAVSSDSPSRAKRRGRPLLVSGLAGFVVVGLVVAWVARRPGPGAAVDTPAPSALPASATVTASAPVAPLAPPEPSVQPAPTSSAMEAPTPSIDASASAPRPHGGPPLKPRAPDPAKKRTMD